MKKLIRLVFLTFILSSVLLSSCTEEEIKVENDNNGKPAPSPSPGDF